jgi:hypothetical protein
LLSWSFVDIDFEQPLEKSDQQKKKGIIGNLI